MPTDDDQHDRSPTAPDGGTAPGADPLVGCALGDFDVLERLAGGPVHAIYRARQRSTGREVALKVLAGALSGSDVAVVGFEAEATAAAAVSHPRVAAVAGWGCESGRHFMVIELVEGGSLAEALTRDERIPPDRALSLFAQIAEALVAVHAAGYLHCGLQPSNVLLTADGDAKLIDFGLARPVAGSLETVVRAGVAEAPLYYPPEAARARPLDERSDLYQLGGLFYHLLAGHPPFADGGPEEMALRYARDDVPALSGVLRTAPVALCRLVHRLLSREPDARYQSAEEVVEALGRIEAAFTRVAAARRTQAAERDARPARREPEEPPPRPTFAQRAEAARQQQRRTVILSAAAIGLCAVIVVALLVVLRRRPEEPAASLPGIGQPATAVAPPAPRPPAPPRKPIVLRAADAYVQGRNARYEKGKGKDNIGFWLSPQDFVSWRVAAAAAGTYEVDVALAAETVCAGNLYVLSIADQELQGTVRDTGGWTEFVTDTIGTVTLPRPGHYVLQVRCRKLNPGSALMNLQAVTLRPASRATR